MSSHIFAIPVKTVTIPVTIQDGGKMLILRKVRCMANEGETGVRGTRNGRKEDSVCEELSGANRVGGGESGEL